MNQELSFGQFVRQRRRELDLTQEELARRVGCAAITIRKIEADDARPSVQIAERLAVALAIPLDDRAEFVRRARAARPEPVEIPTPPPALEEIGLEDLSGRAIRGYALAEKIGAGGMGAVYRARQPLVEREVAIKIILPAYANHPDFIRRFEAEAQLVARLEHPHIVPLYDYWREPGIAYLVMRLLRGGSVGTLLKDGALPVETINRLLEQICYALHAAHRIGVIHRDLKPANVLLDEDHNAYLADFGIAKNLGNPNLADQTDVDMVLGSPAYFSPEQIRSGAVRPQTDIYALGVMLYELLTGMLPFTGPTPYDLIQQHLGAPLPPLAARRDGLPAALDTVISRAAAKDPQDRYADALALLDDFHRAISGVTSLPVFMPVEEEEEEELELVNPYKGLRAFGEADADDYFGRETLIQQLLTRLGEGGDLARFLAVVGPSGSGKSSLVKAGLIPALRRGALVGSENWFVIDFLPGPHPFEELEAALLRVAVNPPESLLAQLKDGERGLLRAVRRVLPGDSTVELVLVIDQFEEVFTLVSDEAERALFLSSLVTAVLDERSLVRVVITLRADFTDRPLRYVDCGELLQRRSEFVLPLTPDELERAIIGPARRVGLRLESGLTSTMTRDVGDQPGALPLLQYALTELFEKRKGRTLTKAAYEAIGGVSAALSRRAEEVYQSLNGAEQATARQLFLRLVTLGEGVEDTRRRVPRSELESLADPTSNLHAERPISNIIDLFGKHRLLTFDRDPITRGPTVEVAHEALLREWSRLREWLNESRADVRMQRTLAEEAAQWNAAQRDASYLLIGAHLEQFEGWAATTTVALTADERAFLDASVEERDHQQAAEAERQQRELFAARQLAETERARADSEERRAEEQTRAANRLHMRNRALAVAGALVTVAAILAIIFGGQANANATRADQNAQQAQTNLSIAQDNAATAQAANVVADQQRAEAVNAQATAVAESQVRATQQALAEANFNRAEAQRLALEANRLLTAGGSSEQIALLSLRSMNTHYTSEGDAALAAAARLDYPVKSYNQAGPVWSATFSPDGKYILVGDDNKTVKLWDARSGQELRRFTGNTAMFARDGKHILTQSFGESIRMWEAATGQEVYQITAITGNRLMMAYSNDGKTILTSSGDHAIRRWDAASGKELGVFLETPEIVWTMAISPDDRYLLTTSNSTGQLLDLQTGQEIREFPINRSHIGFSPDGNFLVSEDPDGKVHLWDVETGQEVRTFIGHTAPIYDIAFSPDNKYLLTSSGDRTVRIWDIQTGQELRRFTFAVFVAGLDFSPDGKWVLTGADDGIVRLWALHASPSLFILNHGADVSALDFSPDGKSILTGGLDGIARLWDAATGEILRDFLGHTDFINYGAAFSPDGKYIVTGSADATVRTWDARTGKEVHQFIAGPNKVSDARFSPDGKYLLTAGDDGVFLWDAQTTEKIRQFGEILAMYRATFSPDGKYVLTAASGSDDGKARLWDSSTGQLIREFQSALGPMNSVDFSPDMKYIIAGGGYENDVRLWDLQTGKELRRLIGHTGPIPTAVFSPDGKYIATASADNTARLWDVQTGKELRRFIGHTAPVENVAFSPDGKHVLTGSDDDTARIWDVDYHITMQYLCSRLLRDFTPDERAQYGITDTTPTCPQNQYSSSVP